MPANALHEGDGEHGKAHHRHLHDVDIAEDRRTKHRAQHDLRHPEQHQGKDERAGEEIEGVLDHAQKPIGAVQQAAERIGDHVRRPPHGWSEPTRAKADALACCLGLSFA